MAVNLIAMVIVHLHAKDVQNHVHHVHKNAKLHVLLVAAPHVLSIVVMAVHIAVLVLRSEDNLEIFKVR